MKPLYMTISGRRRADGALTFEPVRAKRGLRGFTDCFGHVHAFHRFHTGKIAIS